MKKLSVLFALILISLFVHAQEIQQRNVPAVVLNSFQLKYPNATDINWKLEKGNYNVSFETNNKDNDLVMNDKGIFLRQVRDLYASEIPKVVLETINSKIPFFDVRNADRLEEGGKISYRINLEVDDKKTYFVIDDTGKLVKYTKELKVSEVPPQIITQIKTKYGLLDMDNAVLTEDNGTITYQIKGEINDRDHRFAFNNKVIIIKHEQNLRSSELPVQVLNAAKTTYNGYEIRDVNLLEQDGRIIYFLNMRKSNEKIVAAYNADGKIVEVINK